MDRFTAFFLGVVGLVSSEIGSDDLWHGYVFPAVLLGSLLYLFWLKGFLAIAGAVAAFHFMDLDSPSLFKAVLLPLFLVVCIIYFIWWAGVTAWANGEFTSFGGTDSGGSGDGDGGCGGDSGCEQQL